MTTTIKITELTSIGANLASSTVLPVVNMAGTPTTEKTTVGNIANLVLNGAGGNYVAAAKATVANTVITNAQPNITSVGTLTSLTVSGHSDLGIASNVSISGGTSGQVLTTDGAGHLSWATGSGGGTPGGSNTQVQFNSNGSFGGEADFTYDFANNILNVIRANVSYLTAYESVSTANISANGLANIARINVTNTANLGAIGNVTITGGTNGQVLTTNGTGGLSWSTVSGGSNTGNITFNGDDIGSTNDVVNITASNYAELQSGDTYMWVEANYAAIQANGYQWTFNNNAVLTLANDANISQTTDGGGQKTFNITPPETSDFEVVLVDGNARIQTNAGTWTFDSDGATIFPSLTVNLHNGGNQTAQTLQFGNPGQQAVITGPTPAVDTNAERIIIQGQRGTGTGEGGDVYIWGGDSDVNGGDIKIYAGDADTTGRGGNIHVAGGRGTTDAGEITLTGGQNDNGVGAYVGLTGGRGTSTGGTVSLNGGFGEVTGGPINITGGIGGNGIGSYGNVSISAGSSSWIFDNTGNLTVPNSILGGGNLYIAPDSSSPSGRLDIFLTSGPDIHIAGVGENLILGRDDTSNVMVGVDGNVYIQSTTGTPYVWTFGSSGNLSTPGDIVGPANANLTIYANAGVHEFVFADDGTFYAPDNVVLGGNSIYIGPGANTLAGVEHEVLLASSNNFAYVQGVINNVSDNGSAEWVALGAKGNDAGGWGEVGFTSSGFGDANYTITGGGDGYVFAQSYAPGQTLLGGGGNLVLATGSQGSVKDIIFGTGGFLASNIFGRISNANNSFELSRTGATITFPDASVQSTAWTGNVAGANVTGTVANANLSQYLAVSDVNNNFSYHVVLSAGSGDKSLHIDADDNLQYNPADGTLTSVRVDATYVLANLNYANGYLASNLVGSISTIANGNSNVNIATANGNVTINAVGNSVLTVTGTGSNIAGTINVTGNANVSNIGATNGVFTGNISGNTNGFTIGYLNIPQVAASNTTIGLTDAGKHYYSTTAGNFTLTVPNNATTGFATGTAISIVVQAAGNILVNAASGVTLYMAGNSTAANRVVGGYGMATLMKVASDTWFINGTGVS